MVTVVVKREHFLHDVPAEVEVEFFIGDIVSVPCGYMVRLKKQLSIKTIIQDNRTRYQHSSR
jgi:hypothetical protein